MSDAENWNVDARQARQILLEMSQERSVEGVLGLVVGRLVDLGKIALARIWLAGPGDLCQNCALASDCRDRTRCLHLAASEGHSLDPAAGAWNRTDGHFRRVPFSHPGKVALIASRSSPVEVEDVRANPQWIVRQDWAAAERIQGFGGQPLVHQGEMLGVLAVFARARIQAEDMAWLRMLADHAAAAIANARAFEQIERLQARLTLENEDLRTELATAQSQTDIIGQSPVVRDLLARVRLVAHTDSSVLISGESGTGKELVARAVHRLSRRADRPMVTVNCASIPPDLFESEFFGHVKGAFTGAVRDRVGRFHLADGGTLFLDEVGEIPLPLQSKLLRVLQEGTFERVGDHRTESVNVRLIAATNRDLRKEVARGTFREDLFYRMMVFPIEVAPLRKRKEDLPLLAQQFLDELSSRMNRPRPSLTQRHIEVLRGHDWPGNVRELRHIIERALITSKPGSLELDFHTEPVTSVGATLEDTVRIWTYEELRDRERENLRRALEATHWRVSGPNGAAVLLGIKPSTLSSKVRSMGLDRRPRSSGPA